MFSADDRAMGEDFPMTVLSTQSAIVCNQHAGLAIYRLGSGEPLLLIPAPHGFVAGPTAEGPLAALLTALGHTVITFDPPGAFRSARPGAARFQRQPSGHRFLIRTRSERDLDGEALQEAFSTHRCRRSQLRRAEKEVFGGSLGPPKPR
jgi:hypothetical protein